MFQTRNILTGVLVALFALTLFAAPTNVFAKKDQDKAKGAVTAIDLGTNSLTVNDRKDGLVTITVDDSTEIRKDKIKNATLADLVVGDNVDARYNTTTLVATRVRAKSPKIEGTVTAVDTTANTVTIEKSGGLAITVQAVEHTKIEYNGKHATLADFQIGDRGQAVYNPQTFVASKIEAISH